LQNVKQILMKSSFPFALPSDEKFAQVIDFSQPERAWKKMSRPRSKKFRQTLPGNFQTPPQPLPEISIRINQTLLKKI